MNKVFKKYHPKELKDIIGNNNEKKLIEKWLLEFKNEKKNSIIVIGDHGIGKSSTIKLILKKHNINYKFINPDDIKVYRTNDLFKLFFNSDKLNTTQEFVIVFDEIEMISLSSEKKYILNLLKINSKYKLIPIIFICNNNHSKLINDIKKNSEIFKFTPPNKKDIINIVLKLCKINDITIEDSKQISRFIDFSENDIRKLVALIKDYFYNFKKINKKNVDKYLDNSIKKNIEINLFDATEKLFNKYCDFHEIHRLYESEKVLLPLMIHENYFKKILNLNLEDNLNKLLEISNSLSIGDNIETSIYTDQNWYLQEIHGFYTCINTSYILNKANDAKFENITFSSDLNKTSLKNINKKNINNLSKIINKKSIEEILLLCKITNNLFLKNNESIIINILKNYDKNITIKEVELCLKIDKTFDFIKLGNKKKKKYLI